MKNAVESALARASEEQRVRAYQVIEEARNNIKLVSIQHTEDISPTAADAVARNAQIIEEAKRAIPVETMKEVDAIEPPMVTPSTRGHVNSMPIKLDENVEQNIERIGEAGGNNYLHENAVDRAQQRPAQNYIHNNEQSMER